MFPTLLVTSTNRSHSFRTAPLSTAHLALLTPSFHRPPPGPLSLITWPSSPGPILLVSASQIPDTTNSAAVFISTKCKIGSSRSISLRSIRNRISAFSSGDFPDDTSVNGCLGSPKSSGVSLNHTISAFSPPRGTPSRQQCVGPAQLSSSSSSSPHTTSAFLAPLCRNDSANSGPRSRRATPTTRASRRVWRGFASGPRRLKMVRQPSCLRIAAAWRAPGWKTGAKRKA